jgi:hypothetical protein
MLEGVLVASKRLDKSNTAATKRRAVRNLRIKSRILAKELRQYSPDIIAQWWQEQGQMIGSRL